MSSLNSTSAHPVLHASGMSGISLTFVQLVFESEAIAVGNIETVGPKDPTGIPQFLTLKVAQSFRLRLPDQVRVALPAAHQASSFSKNENYLLFLEQVSGANASLIGGGDIGKWPLLGPTSLFTAGHVQPLPKVLSIVEALLKIDEMNRYEDRTLALMREPFVNNALGQIAALQYTVDLSRWPEDRLQGEIDIGVASSLISAQFLLNKTSLDFAAEVELFQLLELVPPTVALPKWIEGLAHSDVAIRDTAIAALDTLVGEDFQYDSREAENLRAEAVNNWKKWFNNHFFDFLKQDVPKLLDELHSGVMLRRKAANLLLRIISGQDVGFLAEEEKSKREAAALRWENWWKKSSVQI